MRILIFVLLSVTVFAQRDTVIRYNKSCFSFTYANDFFTQTDRYFTQGIKLEYVRWHKFPEPLRHAGFRKFPGPVYNGFSVQQDCFTPRSIRYDTVKVGERPYAAVMMASYFRLANDAMNKQRFIVKIDVGAMGPCAVCEQEQKGLHKMLNNIQPLGWEYQLKTDVVLNGSFAYEKQFLYAKYVDAAANARVRAGSLFTDAGFGVQLRLGKKSSPLFAYNLAGTLNTKRQWQLHFTGKAFVKYVAYNATLQGGIFNRSNIYTLPASEIERVVAQFDGSVIISYKKMGVDYGYTFISPEFRRGLYHAWGHAGLLFAF